MEISDVKFANVDGLAIAWQQFGSGPDCLVIPPLVSNIEMQWDHEFYRRALEFQGRHLRVTHFDKRGIGLSDRCDRVPTLEERIADIGAVMDAAHLERCHIFGISEGGLMAQLFAARHPERVDRLILGNSLVAGFPTSAEEQALVTAKFERVATDWGRDARFFVEWFSPSNAADESFIRWCGRFQRQSATQTEFIHQLESLGVASSVDSSQFLGSISAPTLVINASGDEVVNPRSGDHLAAAIKGARRVLVDSDSHFLILGEQWLEVMTLIGEFATGTTLTEPAERRFASIVFTDIVGSTATASAVGDAAWRRALDEHDRIAWSTTTSHAGTVVKSTGDGLLVRFDSPHTAIKFCGDLRRQLAEVGIRIRAGIHTGEIEVRANKDITGVAVNLAARVEQTAPEGTIYVSSTVRDMLLGGETIFEDRGEHTLKGFDQPWRLYECAV